jgi:hypothetical protein
MTKHSSLSSKILKAAALLVVLGAVAGRSEQAVVASDAVTGEMVASVYASQDEAQATMKDLLSAGPAVQRAAPATWSCRFDVRWKARWEASQQYLS